MNMTKTLLTAYSEVCTLLSKHKNLVAYYALKEEEVKTLEHSVEVSRQLYMNGRATYLDVLGPNAMRLMPKWNCLKHANSSFPVS